MSKDILKIIGQRYRTERLNVHYTRAQIANITGYSINAITKFEKGRYNNLRLYLKYTAALAVVKTGKNHGFSGDFRNPEIRSKTFEGIAKAMAEQWGERK